MFLRVAIVVLVSLVLVLANEGSSFQNLQKALDSKRPVEKLSMLKADKYA
jgi:hypothetical protein